MDDGTLTCVVLWVVGGLFVWSIYMISTAVSFQERQSKAQERIAAALEKQAGIITLGSTPNSTDPANNHNFPGGLAL